MLPVNASALSRWANWSRSWRTACIVEERCSRGHAAVLLGGRNRHNLGLRLTNHRSAVLLRFYDESLRTNDLGIRHRPAVVDHFRLGDNPFLEDHARFHDGLRLVDEFGFNYGLGLRQDVLVDDGSGAVDDFLLGHQSWGLLNRYEPWTTGRRRATGWTLGHARQLTGTEAARFATRIAWAAGRLWYGKMQKVMVEVEKK